MAIEVDWGNSSYLILRLINFSRIILYGIALWVQLTLLIELYLGLQVFDVFTVLVPLVLIFVDLMMAKFSRNPFSGFLIVALLVCFVSIYVATITLLPILFSMTIPSLDVYIMRILSLGVFLVSFIEVLMLIYLTRPQEKRDENVWGDDTARTYDPQ